MKYLYFTIILAVLFACKTDPNVTGKSSGQVKSPVAKFEPEHNQCLIFIGQELDAIGGVEGWDNGYMNHFPKPAGFTMYTDFMPGSESFGFIHKGLDGMETTDDWGDGPSNMLLQLNDPDFDGMALAIGLDMKDDHEDDVARGDHDDLIERLGNFIKKLGDRPVFLRIGYEFDGHAWNSYQHEDYVTAYRRIKDTYDAMGIENIAYVWQSKGRGVTLEDLNNYYPGNEYVDWCSFSFFATDNEHHPMLDYARKKNKPVFIGEATPIIVAADSDDGAALDFSKPEDAQRAWDEWFIPFFRTIENNKDIVKAINYINCNWQAHPMWDEVKYFDELDVRIQLDESLTSKWNEKLSTKDFILHDKNR